ncbi:MAG: cytidylate kinase-like family protein [Armatimonadota bacterium]|nr:cytidylate kinase-like family protein [Armatimonadota bacterium]
MTLSEFYLAREGGGNMPKYVEQIVAEQIKRAELSRRASEEWLSGRRIPLENPRIITISRQLGSGGRVVAEILAERIGWSLWDRELVDAIAENAHLNARIVDSFDEKTVSEIEALTRSILGEPEIGGFLFGRQLARVVLSIARRGNAIILGRGANFVLPNALNIRLEASLEARISNMMKIEGLTREEAIDQIHHSDRERAAFTRQVFNKDIDDLSSYDLVIEMDCFTTADAAEIIITAAKCRFPELSETAMILTADERR